MGADSFSGVVSAGDTTASLRALRDVLARGIETCESNRDLAALSQRLVDVLERLEASGGSVKSDDPEGNAFDELARRRADRGAEPPRELNSDRR